MGKIMDKKAELKEKIQDKKDDIKKAGKKAICMKKAKSMCEDAKFPKKCFEGKFKWCINQKKEKDDLEEFLEELKKKEFMEKMMDMKDGGDGKKKACAMKIKKMGWCDDVKDEKKCWAGKMKWCMSHKKDHMKKDDDLFLF